MSSSSSATALKTFSLANDVLEVSPEDQIYRYDAEADDRINQESPWTKECVRV
jgi:COP9 signalosome complex subunit 5